MPERNWITIFAAIGLTVVSVGFGSFVTALYQSEERQERAISAYAYSDDGNSRPQQYLTERSGIPAPIESAISNPQPRTGQDHEKRDLAAQEASATFAWWMVLISGFGFIITTFATILLYQQIRLTREAVKDTGAATLELVKTNRLTVERNIQDSRPFLSIESVEISDLNIGPDWQWLPNLGENRVKFRALVTIKNIGNGVAADALCGMGPGSFGATASDNITYHFTTSQSILPKESKVFHLWLNCRYEEFYAGESYQSLFAVFHVGYRHMGSEISLTFKELWILGREIFSGQMQAMARRGHDDYGDFSAIAQQFFVLDRRDHTRLLVEEAINILPAGT